MPTKINSESPKASRLKVGSTSFSIYPNLNSFTLSWFEHGKRFRKTFPSIKQAKQHARQVKALESPDQEILTGNELNEYRAAIDILNSYAHTQDSSDRLRLDTLVGEAISSRKQAPEQFTAKTTGDIWEELYKSKKDLGKSEKTLTTLRMVLSFTEMFPEYIHEVTEQDILEYNTSLFTGRAPRTIYNYQSCLIEFFNYAQMMKYIPYGDHVANILKKKSIRSKKGVEEVELWNVDLLPSLMNSAAQWKCKTDRKEVVIMVALAAFAACRVCEISRMTWEDNVIWKTKYLRIPAAVSKNNKAHRKVPISPTLEAWLRYAGADEYSTGPITASTSKKYISKRLMENSKAVDHDHVRNGYRHTCISAWLASGVEIGFASLMSDNSPAIIKSNYLGEITKEEGEQWHSIMPPTKK